jgi:hypothetical protein
LDDIFHLKIGTIVIERADNRTAHSLNFNEIRDYGKTSSVERTNHVPIIIISLNLIISQQMWMRLLTGSETTPVSVVSL